MSAEYVSQEQLLQRAELGKCVNCLKLALEGLPGSVWTIWNESIFYCPICAEDEGIGPD
jgi:hypothetical protein